MPDAEAQNVSEFLKKVSELTNDDETNYVFRGESRDFKDTKCMPNVFRNNTYLNSDAYEKHVLNKVRSEGIDNQKSYLLTAIEAQHGGFPSRLLDISYNCLIALCFATLPPSPPKFGEDPREEKDGFVYIIKVENMISPSSTELEDLYVNELLNKKSFMANNLIFAHQHRMIDFYSKNARIKAQQGGFILFYGNECRPLPEYLIQTIKIPVEAKETIRKELKRFFNISPAFIYPESNNIANSFADFSQVYEKNSVLDWKNEFSSIVEIFEKNLKYFTQKFKKNLAENKNVTVVEILEELKHYEQYISEFYYDLDQSIKFLKEKLEQEGPEHESFLRDKIEEIDTIVVLISDTFSQFAEKYGVSFSTLEQLKGFNCESLDQFMEEEND